MNERIQKLYDQAGEYAALNATGDWEVGPAYQDLFNKKFAELIVRECMSITDKCSTGPGLHDLFADNIIAEHFGVEE